MWHEARRQEKILRTTMIDQSKRAERKRRYFENVRKDPDQFMQIHGRKAQIHADLGIARAAEDANILRPWQGDSTITIDRFDARSHLSKMDLVDIDEIIPKTKTEIVDEKEQIVTDFERYRVLIINDYKKVSEKHYLKKIADREFWCAEKDNNRKVETEKKKKSAEKKSTIGFSYDDSEVVKGGKDEKYNSDGDSEEEEMDDMQDLDVDLDTSILNPETQRTVNKSGEEFGVKRGLFCALLKADQQALRDAAQLKQIDRQKAALSGRESKHERMLLRQQRQAIVGKRGMVVSENGATATLLGFINQSQKKSKVDELIEDMEGSDNDDDRRAKPEFITTFGGGADRDSDDEIKKEIVGPELPSEEYRKILKLSQNRRKDDDAVDWGNLKVGGGNGGMNRRSWSRSRSRSRSRSPPRRRSRSRSRTRDRRRPRRSNSRRRSRSRDRQRRSRSRDRRRYSPDRRERRRSRSRDRRRHRSRSTSRRRQRSKDRRRDRSRDRSRDERNEKRRTSKNVVRQDDVVSCVVSEEKPPVKVDEPRESSAEDSDSDHVKMLEIRSSMSDSEKEKAEIENRKRRVKLTKKLIKEKRGQTSNDRSSDEDDGEQQWKTEQARRVKMQMSQALKKTRQELAKEEEDRKKEAEVAQRVRDELRYIETQERRERERAKRNPEITLPPSK
ncbi:Suppressor of white apricot N-terminal domain-containing protein [Caenorhabditis elegans]|uniref:Suppressor of white apricot N-terminal domain-containing protein n=1 Tax=Caenorhabditis elegans TaxID=6239 RepID=Q19854_CAEEL|nr:Suppressor of white apricot N-terminal domain-containing protein [Caenorhabditis elegans]CAA99843.1 Suppressor of white apricot N-terminal domain-containing protein [Caenorhabditis elegans]|eukprot:NP_506124.1 Uncharacterized protein CELE_F28C1.1 [Caenorhabditis elegans]